LKGRVRKSNASVVAEKKYVNMTDWRCRTKKFSNFCKRGVYLFPSLRKSFIASHGGFTARDANGRENPSFDSLGRDDGGLTAS